MWAQAINILIGLWIMVSPGVFDMVKPASDNNHITGPLVVTIATIALWELNRNIRWVNLIAGLWMMIAVWVLPHEDTVAAASNIAAGILIIIFSLVKGKIKKSYGGGWRSLWQKEPLHMKVPDNNKSNNSKS